MVREWKCSVKIRACQATVVVNQVTIYQDTFGVFTHLCASVLFSPVRHHWFSQALLTELSSCKIPLGGIWIAAPREEMCSKWALFSINIWSEFMQRRKHFLWIHVWGLEYIILVHFGLGVVASIILQLNRFNIHLPISCEFLTLLAVYEYYADENVFFKSEPNSCPRSEWGAPNIV